MNLDEALKQFDVVDANLTTLERVWSRMEALIPEGIAFVERGPDGRAYRELQRAYAELVKGLPAISGWRIEAVPLDLDDIAQNRLDAREIDEISAITSIERAVVRPGEEIAEYRSRFTRQRRELVRARLDELVQAVDGLLEELLAEGVDRAAPTSMRGRSWERLEVHFAEVDRLLGSSPRRKAWTDLRRHLSFAMACDLHDIYEQDWPAVKREIVTLSYDDSEPLKVEVQELAQLVAARPTGPVTTALNWGVLDDDGFERLVFALIGDAEGYENAEWLMQTNAPDRGRDLSVARVRRDALSGVIRERLIIQCKHWRSRSVPDDELSRGCGKMVHWEPPAVDVLVFATSGRFTADAVKWSEVHNHSGKRPEIELWAESHLEQLLAQRPHVVASYKLR